MDRNYYLGVDIGSTASKCAIVDDEGAVASFGLFRSGAGTEGSKRCVETALEKAGLELSGISGSCATGYGRNLVEWADVRMSELTCHAKGASVLFPTAHTVIDIGGQDAKVLQVEDGVLKRFVMNDKCAAGTGRFLYVMASVFGCEVSDLSAYDDQSDDPVSISSTCTVFAESEVISKLAMGASIANVAAGVHMAVAEKTCGLVRRLGVKPDVAMTGGVALNDALRRRLEERVGYPIATDPRSQFNGAIGAALIAKEKCAG